MTHLLRQIYSYAMCIPVRRRGRRQKAARLVGPVLVLLSLGLLSCGVPLAASELTATAEVGAATGVTAGATEASSRAAGSPDPKSAPGPLSVSTPASTIAPLSTTSPQPSPTAIGPTPTPSPSTPASPQAGTAGLAAAGGTPDPAEAPSATSTPATDPSAAFLSLLNAYRTAIGRPPLAVNISLSAAAIAYAQYEGRTNSFGHTGTDGSVAETRIARAGYPGRFRGEALAAGQASADAALKTWINSPSHNAIISSADAVEVGIGYAYIPGSAYGHYWVLVTGMP